VWILLVVLIGTNLATLGVLGWYLLRPATEPAPDGAVAGSLHGTPRRAGSSTSSVRRMITIEILNPIELAGSRGRWAGIAGTLAPGLTNRVVYDQALKLVRRQLANHDVVADVRLHVLDPSRPEPNGEPPATA
jgi:hypothetical protein